MVMYQTYFYEYGLRKRGHLRIRPDIRGIAAVRAKVRLVKKV